MPVDNLILAEAARDLEPVTRQVFIGRPESLKDQDAFERKLFVVRKRIDEMGPVNVIAIEEYEEAEQRHAFLTTQCEDLVKAKAELTEVIGRINNETKTMFTETFEKIRANFQTMFVEMFGGGKADLRLVEGEDL